METKTIYEALLEVQREVEVIKKDASANAGKFSYNYATLGQVLEAIKKPLNDRGVIISQPIMGDKVVTCLTNVNGEKIEDGGTLIVSARPDDPQAQGSAISYARRYGLMSLLCLSAEDDDGAKAMPHASPNAPQQTEVIRESIGGKCAICGGFVKSPYKTCYTCSQKK
jgi:hypothetical protein